MIRAALRRISPNEIMVLFFAFIVVMLLLEGSFTLYLKVFQKDSDYVTVENVVASNPQFDDQGRLLVTLDFGYEPRIRAFIESSGEGQVQLTFNRPTQLNCRWIIISGLHACKPVGQPTKVTLESLKREIK